MKKCFVWILFLLMLSGCRSSSDELDAGMHLRSRLLQSSKCAFTAEITADYHGRISTFTLDCIANDKGNLSFNIAQPSTISGISGTLTGEEGSIQFDDAALQFPLSAEDLPSPVSAPWILINALRSGFLTSACEENDKKRISINDTFQEMALILDVWLNREQVPERADILYEGRRILTISVTKFDLS